MKIYNIAIIGMGGLGKRHLQAILNTTLPVYIQVVDINQQSLEKAKEASGEIINENILRLEYIEDIKLLNSKLDVVIVATSSNVRRTVVEYILEKRTVKYLILEKVLFQEISDYVYIEDLINEKKVKTWVNCSRRMMPGYRHLRKELANYQKLNFLIQGSNWGLGCNLIHMIDMIDYTTDSNQNVVCSGELLDTKVLESKRKGFVEFTGTINGSINENKYMITSTVDGEIPLSIYIFAQDAMYLINENENKIFKAKSEDNWKFNEAPFEMMYQSQLTNILIEEIIKSGDCSLPTYVMSKKMHIEIIKMFLKHLNKNATEEVELCPIT